MAVSGGYAHYTQGRSFRYFGKGEDRKCDGSEEEDCLSWSAGRAMRVTKAEHMDGTSRT